MKSVSRRQALLLAFLVVLVAVWAFWPKNDGRARSSVPEGLQQGARGAVRVASELPSLEDLKAERGELAGAVHRNVFRFYEAPTPVPPTPRPTPPPPPARRLAGGGVAELPGGLLPRPRPRPPPRPPPPEVQGGGGGVRAPE